MDTPNYSGQTGFTLIEAMLAALIVGLGFLGLAKLQNGFFEDNGYTRIQIAASHFARQKIEEFRNFPVQNVFNTQLWQPGSAERQGTDNCNPAAEESPCAGINAVLNRSWKIKDCVGAPCRQVEVEVTWTDAKASEKKITLTSYITPFEPVDSGVALATWSPVPTPTSSPSPTPTP